MLVQFYKILMVSCLNSLVPNMQSLPVLVPEHQFMYIIQGAARACEEELKAERMLACSEESKYCY